MKYITLLAALSVFFSGALAEAKDDYQKAVRANNLFGFNFYETVRQQDKNVVKNRLVSPISAYMALSLLANGAKSATEQAIYKTIQATGMSREELNTSGRDLLLRLNKQVDTKNPVKLEIANSVWSNEGFRFREDYVNNVRSVYDAEARTLNFSTPEALKTINGWVSKKTHGKIENILSKIESDFYLINATYFNGPWRHPFNPEFTKKSRFTLESGETTQVDMMHGHWFGRYAKAKDFEAAELRYGNANEASLIVLLPTGKLADLEATLTLERWSEIERLLEPGSAEHSINVSLPKFKFSYDMDLKKPLTDLGMGIAFVPGANFSDMANGVYVNHAIQKTYLGMNEIGTEAAAVTSIGVVTSAPMFPKADLNLDRPFVVVIRDNRTNAILFLGTVANPS